MVTPEPATRAELMMVGIAARTSNTREANPATGQIPALWERFFREGLGERIPKQVGGQTMYSAYTDYESDETGEYRIVVGVADHDLSQVPEGMVGVVVPTGAYLLFHARGTMPGALIETWQAIWSHFARSPQKRAFQTDLEVHHPGGSAVDVYVGVLSTDPGGEL